MGILEIILTVIAWRKGWKWLSIIPLCTAFVIGFLLGLSNMVPPGAIWLDVFAVVALVIMVFNKPKAKEESVERTKPEETK